MMATPTFLAQWQQKTASLVLFADLGLEKNPNVERGLMVWALVVVFLALVTFYSAARRSHLLDPNHPPAPDLYQTNQRGGQNGWPFMKQTLSAVTQVLLGIIFVYVLAKIFVPQPNASAEWKLIRPPHEVTALARHENIIWAGGKEGLFAIDRRTLHSITPELIKARDLRGVRALLVEQHILWIGCRSGLFQWTQEQLFPIAPGENQEFGPVSSVCRGNGGELWVGTSAGAWRYHSQSGWKHFDQTEGLDLPTVDVIFEDRRGDIWFGSNAPEASGLFHWDHGTQQISNRNSGLVHHAINDLMEDRTDTLWAATGFGSRGGAVHFSDNRWQIITVPNLEGEKIRSLFEDSGGRIWFCSEYSGVSIRNGKEWQFLTRKVGFPAAEVKDMLEDEDRRFWMATERGLVVSIPFPKPDQ